VDPAAAMKEMRRKVLAAVAAEVGKPTDDFLFPIISRLPLPVRGSSSRPRKRAQQTHFPAHKPRTQVSQEIHPAE
jgi:hypothetical protein